MAAGRRGLADNEETLEPGSSSEKKKRTKEQKTATVTTFFSAPSATLTCRLCCYLLVGACFENNTADTSVDSRRATVESKPAFVESD